MSVLRVWAVICGLAVLCLGAAAGSAGASSSATMTTVVSGLDNPRDLAFGPNGRLYVAEAGHGGLPVDCVSGGEGGGTACFGLTSAVSRVETGSFHRVISGLASIAEEGGFAAVGIDGISFKGNKGYAIEAESREAVPPRLASDIETRLRRQLGHLIQFTPGGAWKTVADVGHRNYVWSGEHSDLNPGQFPDTNPYGVLAVEGSRWIVDAGANTINRVWPNGTIARPLFIPSSASNSVPTCIDRGPDGAFYVGELTGGGDPPGSASIWRFAPGTAHPLTRWATGLTTVTGCGFGHDGQFYATEFSTLGLMNAAPGTGRVVRVAPHSTSPELVVDGLSFPGGFAGGRDGSIYVSNWSIAPATVGLGSVVRIDQ